MERHQQSWMVLSLIITAFSLSAPLHAGQLIAWGSNSAHQTEVPAGKNFTAVAAGKYHNLALKDDGSLVSWGDDAYKQVTDTPTDSGYIGIACGDFHSVAWKSDGTVIAWGRNHFSQIDVPECPECSPVTSVICGSNHTLALHQDQSLTGWGNNDEGQLIIPDSLTFQSVAAGGKHNIAILSDGTLRGWGWDIFGQALIPAGLDNHTIQVSCGQYHSLALKDDGSILAWGLDSHQQANVPEPYASRKYLAISAGELHNMALRDDYSVDVWGNTPADGWHTPANNDFILIAAGGYHCVGIIDPRMRLISPDGGESFRGNERVRIEWEAWDDIDVKVDFSPDNGTTWTTLTDNGSQDYFDWTVPQIFSELCLIRISDASDPDISDQSQANFRIFGSGIALGWGSNFNHQIDVPETDDIVAVAAGHQHSLALKADSSLVSWGSNEHFLIDNTPSGNDFTAIAAGGYHSLALRKNGSIVGWGNNNDGQADPPDGTDFVAIAAGAYHSMALKDDGTIVVWGDNDFGQVSLAPKPANNIKYKAIGAGYYFCMAIEADTGKIVAWGENSTARQLEINTSQTDKYLQVTGGRDFGVALTEAGSIIQWGGGAPSNKPSGSNFVQIAANKFHAAALTDDGQIISWSSQDPIGRTSVPLGGNYLSVSAGMDHTLAVAEPQILLLDPNGTQNIPASTVYPIRWQTHIPKINLEYSTDNGLNWTDIIKGAISNTGSYDWQVPDIASENCLVRVSSYTSPTIFFAVSPATFRIYHCSLNYDLNQDCQIDLSDLALLLTEWLQCGDPLNPDCLAANPTHQE